ncbi:MAG: xanthine dehydrogenase family protein molybdopterin-binding subunit [Betaproteobacteria bacterium]|nr:xanthine dehydrogenase family protein molybdopterin-binding subunit [Betaproteobacteria bacterium]
MLKPALRPRLPVVSGCNAEIAFSGWIELTTDGGARSAVPRCEMGQGVYTALAMLAAEELDIPLERVKIMDAPVHKIFGNIMVAEAMLPALFEDQRLVARSKRWLKDVAGRQTLGVSTTTGGSTSLRELWRPIRMVGAQARASLVNAAARLYAADPRQCRTETGFVVLPNGTRLTYAEVLSRAIVVEPARDFNVKSPEQFRLIGRSPTRTDARAKGDGSVKFASDVRLPGMCYAALAMPPSIGATLVTFRVPLEVQGAEVVPVPAGYGQGESLAVIADSWWTAQQIAGALDITWNEITGATIDTNVLASRRRAALDGGTSVVKSVIGDPDATLSAAGNKLEAEYAVPYLAHAAMEPMNCTAQVSGGIVRVWAPVQAPRVAIAAAAQAANVKAEAVEMVVPMLGGGFGRRLEADFVFQSVAIASQADGRPVHMIWTREQDFRHDFYRPAATARLRAAIDATGKVMALDLRVASESVGRAQDSRNEPGTSKPASPPIVGGLAYAIPHQCYRHVQVNSAVPIGSWRSVDASYNGFFYRVIYGRVSCHDPMGPCCLAP